MEFLLPALVLLFQFFDKLSLIFNLSIMAFYLELKWLNLNCHTLFIIPHLLHIVLCLFNKVFKVLFIPQDLLSFFFVHFDDHLIFSYLSLQLLLDFFLFSLLLHWFFHKIKQLVLISFHLTLFFLNWGYLLIQLKFKLLSLVLLIGKLRLETLFHVLFLVCLESLKFIEGLYQILIVSAELFCLSLSSKHLDKAINVALNRQASGRSSLKWKTDLSELNFEAIS